MGSSVLRATTVHTPKFALRALLHQVALCDLDDEVLSRLDPLAGVGLDAHAHQLAELIQPFVGESVAGEVALPLSGHEPSVQQHAQML